MSTIYRILTLSLAIIGSLVLFSCDTTPKQIAICPKVTPLEQGGYLTKFLPGPGRDITDITLEANFSRIAGECNVTDDEVVVGAYVELTATQGPAMQEDFQTASIYIFVLSVEKRLIKRREIPIKFEFPDNQLTIKYTERFFISIPKDKIQNGNDFIVYLSFKLTPAELEFNREEKKF